MRENPHLWVEQWQAQWISGLSGTADTRYFGDKDHIADWKRGKWNSEIKNNLFYEHSSKRTQKHTEWEIFGCGEREEDAKFPSYVISTSIVYIYWSALMAYMLVNIFLSFCLSVSLWYLVFLAAFFSIRLQLSKQPRDFRDKKWHPYQYTRLCVASVLQTS